MSWPSARTTSTLGTRWARLTSSPGLCLNTAHQIPIWELSDLSKALSGRAGPALGAPRPQAANGHGPPCGHRLCEKRRNAQLTGWKRRSFSFPERGGSRSRLGGHGRNAHQVTFLFLLYIVNLPLAPICRNHSHRPIGWDPRTRSKEAACLRHPLKGREADGRWAAWLRVGGPAGAAAAGGGRLRGPQALPPPPATKRPHLRLQPDGGRRFAVPFLSSLSPWTPQKCGIGQGYDFAPTAGTRGPRLWQCNRGVVDQSKVFPSSTPPGAREINWQKPLQSACLGVMGLRTKERLTRKRIPEHLMGALCPHMIL